MNQIRNFCIIAHIDHGKSTLADRFLEVTGTITSREMRAQYLDTMDLERERGITIKLQPVQMRHDGHVLNLIDTPGHVDFSYEVSRSLAAVEGAILLVDASQGIEAQTLANLHLAMEHDLVIIPVVNKIDLPAAEPERVAEELQNLLGIEREEIILASGKTGAGVEEILRAVIERVPAPKGEVAKALKALVFDSYFDAYKGVMAYVRVVDGEVRGDDKILMMANRKSEEVLEVGIFSPKLIKRDTLKAGEIGYIATGLKDVSSVQVGDTITLQKNPALAPLAGYKKVSPFVYAGIFTVDNNDYPELREALDKLKLNDASLTFEPENSPALGFGFRCGFLGLLHMEIVQERLEREFDLNLVITTPSVGYEIELVGGSREVVHNPTELPEANRYKSIAEPWIKLDIITPATYVGAIMKLVQDRRGVQRDVKYLDSDRTLLIYEVPLSSVVTDFYDNLKSVSSGYASMSYEFLEYRAGDLVKVDVLLNEQVVDALSVIVHRKEAQGIGRQIVAKLRELIPRQNFKIPVQAAIGGKVIAREDIPPFRKDVTAKLYGGDRTRKDKLLQKQAKGKKRMKMVGRVEIPQEAFMRMLSSD